MIGITALVPPELIYACGQIPIDVNNFIPHCNISPEDKLCAWTAAWREMILKKTIKIDSLIVVAGGDCHNALVDGQRVAFSGFPTHFFFYPFDGDASYLESQLEKLDRFLGGIKSPELAGRIKKLKQLGLKLDKKRCEGQIASCDVFEILISFSDMRSDVDNFEKTIEGRMHRNKSGISDDMKECNLRLALIGVPPIYPDFHKTAQSFGMHIVFDELPYEFIRHSGTTIDELARSYSEYTFARNLNYRISFLEQELSNRKIDGVIHYTQFACHHILEDSILRDELDYPILTVQGDLPQKTPEQLKLRLEAFGEMLRRR